MLLDLDVINNIVRTVEENIEKKKYKQAALSSQKLSPLRIGSILMQSDEQSAAKVIKEIESKDAGMILANMSPEFAVAVLSLFSMSERVRLLNVVPVDNVNNLLLLFQEDQRKIIVAGLQPRLKKHLAKIKQYPENSAGRIMNPYFLSVKGVQTAGETLESVVSAPSDIEKTPYIYVLDSLDKPIGVISMKDLLRVGPDRKNQEIMNPNLVVVGVKDSAREAADTIRKRRFMMLPVVDESGIIAGVITFDDAMKVLSEDAAILLGGAFGTQEESFFTPPLKSVKSRLPWMVMNLFLNMGAVAVISSFEATIATVAILAAFIPMITDMGGNVGIQSLSVAIRSIALGEASLQDFRKALHKEFLIGISQGAVLGLLFALIAFALRGNPFLGVVAGIALGINVLIACAVGGTLPFFIKSLGKDPAMMTGPFLTTITDISGVSIYLGLAALFVSFLSG